MNRKPLPLNDPLRAIRRERHDAEALAWARERIADAIAARMLEGATYDDATAEAFAYLNARWPNLTARLIAEAA